MMQQRTRAFVLERADKEILMRYLLPLVLWGALVSSALAQTVDGPKREGQPAPPQNRPVLVGSKAETTCASVDDGDVRGVCLSLDGAVKTVLGAGAAAIGNVDVDVMGNAATANAGVNAQTADFNLFAAVANTRLFGWSCRESAATAGLATVILRHSVVSGGNCTGSEIAYIEFDANQSTSMWYGDRGIAAASGVCADVLAGTVDCTSQSRVEAAP